MKRFDIFKKECLRLQKEWGLSGWELSFKYEPKNKKQYASIVAEHKIHKATIYFSGLDDEFEDTKKTAKHEMIHLVIARLTGLGEARYTSEETLLEAEEEVIQVFLKIIK